MEIYTQRRRTLIALGYFNMGVYKPKEKNVQSLKAYIGKLPEEHPIKRVINKTKEDNGKS